MDSTELTLHPKLAELIATFAYALVFHGCAIALIQACFLLNRR